MHPSWRGLAALLLILGIAVAAVSASSAAVTAAAASSAASLPAHQPRFTVENAQGSVPLNVTFHDVSTVPGVTDRTWDFGDGTTGTGKDPVHTYTVPGSYTVTLKLAVTSGVTTNYQHFQMANVVRASGVPTPTGTPAPLAGALAGLVAAALLARPR
jgi:plastocyanin